MSFTGTRDKLRSCSENKTSREINLQLIVCGLELCAYITLSSKFTKYVNYENVPSTTIHFLEANYTTPLGISTVLKIILFQSYQTATEENAPTCPSPSMLIFLDLINALKRIEY